MGFNLIFMGTPDYAVPTLERLAQGPHRVSLVVTQPDRRKGRKKAAAPPPVKAAALRLGLEVTQPASIRDDSFRALLCRKAPDLFAVVAFGHILSADLLRIPSKGAVNAHASLLPKYRGAAPIQWAIINGETDTGVTTIRMDDGMDTGDILLSRSVKIGDSDTAETLHDRLSHLSADLMIDTLDRLSHGRLHPVPQDHARATTAPMLAKGDGRIDWRLSAAKIERRIRGVTPWPGAFTYHGSNRLKLFAAKPVPAHCCRPPGTVLTGFPEELCIATGDQALSILEIQSASGKRLPIAEFLRGYRISPGSRLT